ncbi:TetR/AcrR family transcriptional regulator [Mycolicibacterium baixiangningiae]|uniref:TetR/AcrR family transcriptional regulator n=1 Tax=Mycolicibacterium baixiangningiae TaxID=2761578 RepID=UPI00186871F0|nr:TetR/AcrR family transcriptional regulator [Mycolicibacterium baixiangningiae]
MSGVRQQLIEAGVRLMERDGLPSLSARSLATEAGTSTMAVYTHFGGMTGVVEAIAREAFDRFTRALTEIPRTDDPVADFIVMGVRYREFALAHPERYQMMFGTSAKSLNRHHTDVTTTGNTSDSAEFAVSFEALLDVVSRMVEAGRIRDDGVPVLAGRLWSLTHGAVLLEIAGFFGHEDHGLTQILAPLVFDTLVGMGAEREQIDHSLEKALRTLSGAP